MMYGVKNRLQSELFLYAFGAGFLIGLIYAGLLLLRRLICHHDASIALEDILIFILGAFLSFIFLLDFNNGILRINLILSECLGFLAAHAAAKKILSKKHKNHLQELASLIYNNLYKNNSYGKNREC